MATKVRRYKINIGELFQKYDKNNNNMLDAAELTYALKKVKVISTDQDERVLKEHL